MHDVIHRVMPTVCQYNTCKMFSILFIEGLATTIATYNCMKKSQTFLKVAVSKSLTRKLPTSKTCKILFSIGGIELIPCYTL